MLEHRMSSAYIRTIGGASYCPTVRLRYRMKDPYAVDLVITDTDTGQEVVWTLSRDLLKVGVRRRAGIGDVIVRPYYDDPGDFSRPCMAHIHLSSDDGECDLRFPMAELESFLAATADMVAYGAESEHLDVDLCLRLCFASQGRQLEGEGG